jgi:hypothetical protein
MPPGGKGDERKTETEMDGKIPGCSGRERSGKSTVGENRRMAIRNLRTPVKRQMHKQVWKHSVLSEISGLKMAVV